MAIDINGSIISGGTSLTVTDSSNNKIYQQLSTGQILKPTDSSNNTRIPLFNVGWSSGGWTTVTGTVPFSYTAGSGYFNVGSCYNTSTYRFTAPWQGLYLFKEHMYVYGANSTYTWYLHPQFSVNGSFTTRRPGGTPYRIRLYGMRADYGHDTDCSEIIYLSPGDYVEVSLATSGTIQGYAQYCSWSGVYLGA